MPPAPGSSDPPAAPRQGLEIRRTADGSFSLWSEPFAEGFHSGRGAVREARETFLAPAELSRFARGSTLTVVEVCVGTASNTAALLEACADQGLRLEWWGLELDAEPLRLALADAAFRGQWRREALEPLQQLQRDSHWQSSLGQGWMLWGDARRTVQTLPVPLQGGVQLVLHDAFSPRHCPQLWTMEFLGDLGRLLAPQGRLISYCSAAAVRQGLQLAGLELAAIPAQDTLHQGSGSSPPRQAWSGGTVASPRPLAASAWLRPLTPMEQEHLATSAAEPYRDPQRNAEAATILANRSTAQAAGLANGSLSPSSAWRRRWGLALTRQPAGTRRTA